MYSRKKAAASALTKHIFSPDIRQSLSLYEFASNWWILDTVAKSLGVHILVDHTSKGHKLPSGSILFNVLQTDSASQLESHAGNLYPRLLLTGQMVHGNLKKKLFSNLDSECLNLWIAKHHLDKLEIPYKKGSEVECVSEISNGNMSEWYCDASKIVDKSTIDHLREKWPRAVDNGNMFKEEDAINLFKSSYKNKFSSVFWLTKSMADNLCVSIMSNQQPTEVNRKGCSLSLYNADQVSDSKFVTRTGYQNRNTPINVVTMKPYEEPLASKLLVQAVRSARPCSRFWLNEGENTRFGVRCYDFDDDRCMFDGMKNAMIYNLNMMSDSQKVIDQIRSSSAGHLGVVDKESSNTNAVDPE